MDYIDKHKRQMSKIDLCICYHESCGNLRDDNELRYSGTCFWIDWAHVWNSWVLVTILKNQTALEKKLWDFYQIIRLKTGH